MPGHWDESKQDLMENVLGPWRWIDALGIQWLVSRSDAGESEAIKTVMSDPLLAKGVSPKATANYTGACLQENPYGIPMNKVVIASSERDGVTEWIDDQVYAYRVSKGDLKPQSGNLLWLLLLVVVLEGDR